MDPYDQDAPMDTSPTDIPSAFPLYNNDRILFLNDDHAPAQMHVFPIDDMAQTQMLPPVTNFMDIASLIDPYALAQLPDNVDLSPATRTHSASPPQSQIPSPSIHGTSSSYAAGVTSSLESALHHTGRSRANTSLSPPSSFPSLSPPNLQATEPDFPPSLPSTSSLEESVSQTQPQTVIGKMLKNIAITAIDAGEKFENSPGLDQSNKVGELRDRIMQVLNMLSSLTMEKDTSSYNPSIPVMSGIVTEQAIPNLPTSVPSVEPVPAVDPIHLSVSESRKRCASELEEHRTVKALKREPQDDAPLTLSIQEAPIIPPIPYPAIPQTVNPFAPITSPLAAIPPSQPPSRPPTPPSNFAANNSFGVVKPTIPKTSSFSAFASLPPVATPLLIHSTSVPIPPAAVPPAFHHAPWSDPGPSGPSRHHHSLSAGAISGPPVVPPTVASQYPAAMIQNALPQPPHSVPSNAASSTLSHPIGRMSRSGSVNGMTGFRNAYAAFPYGDLYSDPSNSWHPDKASSTSSRAGQSSWHTTSSEVANPSRKFTISGHSAPSTTQNSPSDDEDDDEDSDSDESISGKTVAHHTSGDRHLTSAAELPAEYHHDVDRVFFEFLNKLCSKLDATDAKGEQIHQTLMAKKMQRLDESPDFRPFKFRIQAFTNAFMDELAKQGYPEDKIPMKKVRARNYLWRQNYILRFNEDGKKAKSKGNHIWNVEARKAGEGQWEFRPFQRKLAGTPSSVAYCGLRWSWKPHVWHPQCSFKKIHVTYSSPSLPAWLSWKNGELSGIPPPNAESCQITAIGKFTFENQDDQVEHTFTITIAPASALEGPPYSRSRRPSLVGEPPKRSTSDSALFQAPQRTHAHARINRADDTRVIRVLQSIAQRVTDEAQSQFVSSSPPKQGELQDLVKQKHVLEQTVDAYDKAISGHGHEDSRRLAVAAQHVVLQAAQTVMADRTVASGGVPTPQAETVAIQSVSVSELTDKTQDAIAMAVKMNGTANEVDIIVTATSILKSQTPAMDTPPSGRPQAPVVAAPSRLSSTLPLPTLSPLREYV
ncbi:hypothetical protein BDN70DRAFT_883186 [Pholiota conissans]|uniref:Uncharacterized protein n=1 Tax=Pholiota conissans TaxID=109636 RepID=A0A9P5YVG3_9AGAR|nr:hypothetical protein BDN70DRAFT_883186 [Pholiota conissans]